VCPTRWKLVAVAIVGVVEAPESVRDFSGVTATRL
jgi:hypothetical protein